MKIGHRAWGIGHGALGMEKQIFILPLRTIVHGVYCVGGHKESQDLLIFQKMR